MARREALVRLLRIVSPWIVTLALFGALAARLDPDALYATLSSADPRWVLLAAALGPLQIALSAERWRIASAAVGHDLQRWTALREFALSALLNQILPGGVSGDVIRAVRVRETQMPMRAARVVLIDRVVGLSVHLLVVLAGLLLWPLAHEGVAVPWPIGLLALALLAVFAAGSAHPGVLGRDARLCLAGWPGLEQFALSAALTGSFLLGFTCCGRAIGHPIGVTALTAVPIVLLSMALPLTVGGWGIREWTASAVLAPIGWSPEDAVGCSAVYGLSVWIGSLPGLWTLLPWSIKTR